jgi:hypothetical protein
MARYNTVAPTTTSSGTATVASPTAGLLTTLTGTAPYTVTLADPRLFTGQAQTFYNATGGIVTLASPINNIKGPGFTTATSQTIPNNGTYTITSDGTDYVITNNEGGPQAVTTLTASGLINANGGISVPSGQPSNFNGATVQSSSNQTINSAYDLITLTYLQTKYGNIWTVKNSAYTAVAGDRIFADTTSSAFTLTLPATATIGDQVQVIDYGSTFNTRNLTVGNNGNRIQGILDNMTVSTNGAAFTLVWSGNATYGWRMATGI